MSHPSVTPKRQNFENHYLGPQPSKKPRTDADDFHSITPNQINGHSYALPSYQEGFNQRIAPSDSRLFIPSPAALPTSSSGVSQVDFYALKERVTQLDSRVSLLERLLDRSLSSQPRSVPLHNQQTMLSDLAMLASSQPPIVTTPDQPVVMTTAIDPSLVPPEKTDFEKGSEFLARKEYKKAIEHYLKALGAKPSDSYTIFCLGNCYVATEEHQKAIDCLSKIPPRNLFYWSAQVGIGGCHRQLQDPSKAIEHYEKVTRDSRAIQYPIFCYAQNCLGLCYIAKNDPQTAISCFKKALIFEESCPSSHLNRGCSHFYLGTTYLELKDDSKAIMHFKLVPKDHEMSEKAQEHLKQCQTTKSKQ